MSGSPSRSSPRDVYLLLAKHTNMTNRGTFGSEYVMAV
ncbi:hypothetical protein SAMN04487751_1877 [Microbacterium saccharophilum]|uniref:Uncharacterized protein n=1 Tax=Microbacterium saccharophilum TaxID=1213358 RepID=A0A7Z7GE17_9MICO|nr:hypothetical protein SAMN04487751_1877 [Microbacterium saccharophilum]